MSLRIRREKEQQGEKEGRRENEAAVMRILRVLESIDFLALSALLFSSVYFSLTRLPLHHTSAVIWHLWGSGSRHFGDIIRTALIKHGQIVTFKDLGNN